MIAFKVELSRSAAKAGVDPQQFMRGLVGQGAAAMADAVRIRVQIRGDLAASGQSFPGYSAKKAWKATAPGYPDRAAGKLGPSGAEFYRSSAEYHYMANATVPGSYDVTGGMWSGLSTVIQGETRADIMFRGRSMGRDPNFRRRTVGRPKKGQQRQTRVVARGLQINNQLKAATILQAHGINVLAPSQQEVNALTEGVVSATAYALGQTLPIDWAASPVQPLPVGQAFAHRHWG